MDTSAIQASLGNVVASAGKGDLHKARKAAEDFEAIFLAQMLSTMNEGIQTDGPFGGGQSETMWRGMLNEQYAASIARQGGIGIADQVYGEILKMQDIGNTQGEQ
jgi:Rod binding domain-containing protein